VWRCVGYSADGSPAAVDNAAMTSPAPDSEPGQEHRPTAGAAVRRVTWLLLLLLAAVGIFAGSLRATSTAPDDRSPYFRSYQAPAAPEPARASGMLADVYERARPAAVRIESRCANPLFGSSPIDVGSGFFVSAGGELLTAYHVIRRQAPAPPSRCGLQYVAVDSGGAVHPLELVSFDAYLDLALLRARVSRPVPYLPLAATVPAAGTEVVAIGNSRGEFLADRAGSVSRVGVRSVRPEFASGTVELTAALAPGDSGGPVLTADGEAFGVVSYISFEPAVMSSEGDAPFSSWFDNAFNNAFTATELPEFASYAVPVLAGSDVIEALRSGLSRDVPVIGFEVAFDYDPRSSATPWLGRRPGVVVGRVQRSGPGDEAGLRSLSERRVRDAAGRPVGTSLTADVIVAVDGRPTPTFERLLEVIRARNVGQRVILSVQRGERSERVAVVLGGHRQVFR
jgi:serine protease Do